MGGGIKTVQILQGLAEGGRIVVCQVGSALQSDAAGNPGEKVTAIDIA